MKIYREMNHSEFIRKLTKSAAYRSSFGINMIASTILMTIPV